ncbi:nif-specific transcriptional activator NifA [Paracraurococcus lichenis]|uniref:Nif-specific regulatory protein n=1 Tax=Paracraurococcus lichenis TaxID=3064888 RepID=A0ABT9E137_9PROT|nr:nif-specific transcriptional activator NifA [Paracraurococcus sp. LOR1-02]MDO9709881.1 nif-specific transcriptional activator NifA [Paracraurococcus sp. LOR1-02]
MPAVPMATDVEAIPKAPRRSMDLHGIYEISKILCRPDSLPRILKSTLGVLDSFLDMSLGLIVLLDEAGEPELITGGRLNEADAERCFQAMPERAIGQIVVTHVPVVLDDVAAHDEFGPWDTSLWGAPDRRFTFIGVPIRERERTLGLLIIARAWTDHPTIEPDSDIRFLKMVGNLMAQTIRLHRVLARDRDRLLDEQRRMEKARDAAPSAPLPGSIAGIVGRSPQIRAVVEKVRVAARRDVTVLLRGESGTGKELFAQAIHNLSARAQGPFVTLNCAALPESVLESELFGHEKGAFTGALNTRKGRFELADGGTLFLDEIGEISAAFQAKLLRVLQEGEFERVGGSRTLKVNVRLVAATNRNLEEAVAKGTFRADLYYRISVVPVLLPPLRDRRGDIPLLADNFLARFNKENATGIALDRSAYDVLTQCNFPGNVRELENCIRRTATLTPGARIVEHDFACRNDGCLSALLWKPGQPAAPLPVVTRPAPAAKAPEAPCDKAESCAALQGGGRSERDRLVEAMEKTGWVQAKAARLLNLTPRQIGYALRKHGIPIQKL